jgi:hypothetical protein
VRQDSETGELEDAGGSLHVAEDKVSGLNPQAQCARNFGYLSERSKGEKIPEECMTCEKMLDCMVKTAKKEASNSQ